MFLLGPVRLNRCDPDPVEAGRRRSYNRGNRVEKSGRARAGCVRVVCHEAGETPIVGESSRHPSRRDFLIRSAATGFAVAGCKGGIEPERRKPPNFLFIIDDQHSPRAMGWTGQWDILTPNLDQLARESVCFTNAYTACPLCAPNRHSLISGRYPSDHGVTMNDHFMREGIPTLARHLNAAGYTTASIGKMHNAPAHARRDYQYVLHHEYFDSPVAISHYAPYLDAKLRERNLEWPVWWNSPSGKPYGNDMAVMAGVHWLPEDLLPERWVTDEALRFIDDQLANRPDKPFFLHVSYFPPHDPYRPIEKYARMYDGREMDLPPNFDLAKAAAWGAESGVGELSAEEYRRIRRLYSALVTQLDEHIGMLLRGLADRGLAEDTIVMFTSDHGDMIGEHGRLWKFVLYEAAVRVPCMIRWPGAQKPRLESSPISFVDLFPTILRAAGVEPESGLPGSDLRGLIGGDVSWPDRAVIAENYRHGPKRPSLMVRRGPFKYVVEKIDLKTLAGEQTLYNLEEDPWELRDLSKDPGRRAVLNELREIAVEHLAKQRAGLAAPFPGPMPKERPLYKIPYPADPWTSVEPAGTVPYWTLRIDDPWRVHT